MERACLGVLHGVLPFLDPDLQALLPSWLELPDHVRLTSSPDRPPCSGRNALQEYYRKLDTSQDGLPPGLEGALTAIFEDHDSPDGDATVVRKPAAALLHSMERELVANVYLWTGHFPERTRALVRHLASRAEELEQVYAADQEPKLAVAITTLVTALAMNHVHRGTYLP